MRGALCRGPQTVVVEEMPRPTPGPEDVVANMAASCRRGPPSARVSAVVEEAAGPDALGLRHPGERFSVLPTV